MKKASTTILLGTVACLVAMVPACGGEDGAKGDPGAAGASGAAGPAGSAGGTGAAGAAGAAGTPGTPGTPGASFDAGPPTTTCKTLKAGGDNTDGLKTIKLAGVDTQVYCDQTTEGGGWTVVFSATGAAGEEPPTSDTAVAGDPIAFAAYNTTRAIKIAVAKQSTESLFLRDAGGGTKGPFLIANHEMFDENLADPNGQATYSGVTVHDSSVPPLYMSQIQMGWSRFNITRGGDFGLTSTNVTFDNHQTVYWMLRSGCVGHLLYSYTTTANTKAGFDVNTGLGLWTATTPCHSADGGVLKFYAAMR